MVPLCTLTLSNGRRCQAVALRNQRFCRHHIGNHRQHTRERRLGQRLDRLSDRLDEMNAAKLLSFLHQILIPLSKTLTRYPELQHTLIYTLDRLNEINTLESNIYKIILENHELTAQLQAIHSKNRNLQPSLAESNT